MQCSHVIQTQTRKLGWMHIIVKPDVLILMGTLQTSARTLVFWLTVWVEQVASCASKLLRSFGTSWQGAFSIYRKIPENSGNFSGKCLSVKDMLHLTHSSHSFPGSLHRPMYFPPKYKMAAQLLLLNEMLDFSLEDESLINSDDDFIPILAAVATYMGRHLHRNQGFYESIFACIYDRWI